MSACGVPFESPESATEPFDWSIARTKPFDWSIARNTSLSAAATSASGSSSPRPFPRHAPPPFALSWTALENGGRCQSDWITTFKKQLYSPSRLRKPPPGPSARCGESEAKPSSASPDNARAYPRFGRSFLVSLTDASSAACISSTANPLSSTGGPVDPADDPSDPPLGAGRANAG